MPGMRPAFQSARHGDGDNDLTMNATTAPLNPTLSSQRGEGVFCLGAFTGAHLPWANFLHSFRVLRMNRVSK